MKPRVVFLSFATLKVGGIERQLLQLVEHLRERYSFHVAGVIAEEFARAVRSTDAAIALHPMARVSKFNLIAVHRLQRLFRQIGAGLVHTVEPRSRLLGHLAARRAGIPAVHTFHMSALSYDDLSPLRQRFYQRIEAVYNQHLSDRLIFVSHHDYGRYAEQGLLRPDNATVIHNAIDPSPFTAARRERARLRRTVRAELGIPEEAVLSCTVGRLSVQKGIDYLLQALHQVASRSPDTPDLFATIVGDGEERERLAEQARALGITERVRFLGARPLPDVVRILTASDLFVLPSRFECFPYSILEALAAGLPCVVSDVGGNRESVEHGYNGFVLPRGDVLALASALERLTRDADLRATFGRHALEKIQAFSVDHMIRETEAVYRSVLQTHP